MEITDARVASIHYTLTDDSGKVLDKSPESQPLRYFHGAGNIVPGLERALARIVVTPSIHWVHHHAVRRDTDSNYATVLSLWDPLFRSRSAASRRPDMAIGVEGRDEETLAGLFTVSPYEPKTQRLVTRLWTKIVTGQ